MAVVKVFDKKARAEAYATKMNKNARKYHYVIQSYYEGYKVYKRAK